MSDTPIQFALLGYGAFGRNHALAIEAADGAHFAAIAESSEDGAAAAKQAHPDASIYRDY